MASSFNISVCDLMFYLNTEDNNRIHHFSFPGINVCCDLVSNSYHIVVRSFVIDLCVLFTFVL